MTTVINVTLLVLKFAQYYNTRSAGWDKRQRFQRAKIYFSLANLSFWPAKYTAMPAKVNIIYGNANKDYCFCYCIRTRQQERKRKITCASCANLKLRE